MKILCVDNVIREFKYKEVSDPDELFADQNVIAMVCSHCNKVLWYEGTDVESDVKDVKNHVCKEQEND